MKKTVPIVIILLLLAAIANAQITTPMIRANFGVEADLRANVFAGSISPGNDDWFSSGTAGSGIFVIDTTGAAAMVSQYPTDTMLRKKAFIRGMNYPMYSTVNGKLLYDAVYVRDHHKTDSTSFASSNKNGQSPAIWVGGTTQVLNKSDINDVMVHVRRDGPGLSDSLWFFAGLSLLGTTGNRYFDFELYQTDIFYSPADNKFHNVGAEAGHTAWQFDALGNVTRPGDVIFTAEFSSSALTLLEARIWIDKSSLSITPVPFSWGGLFDGDGSGATYGYANILPKTAGNFYGGMQCAANIWAGPFSYPDPSDITKVNYGQRNYMEVAVNMSKIGLDPYTILGSSCNLSFRKVFAKTRSSTSFTSELKDFVGPYALATPPAAVATGNVGVFCGTGVGDMQLMVTNPLSTSTYTWTTTNGNIITSPSTGPTIAVDQAGTYVVTQTLHTGCTSFAIDTVTILQGVGECAILAAEDIRFTAKNNYPSISLNWTSSGKDIARFDVQRSTDGHSFQTINTADAVATGSGAHKYEIADDVYHLSNKMIYYRLKISKMNRETDYSNIISIKNTKQLRDGFNIAPNPASDFLQVSFSQSSRSKVSIGIYNSMGHEVQRHLVKNQSERINIGKLLPGVYFIQAYSDGSLIGQKKLLVTK